MLSTLHLLLYATGFINYASDTPRNIVKLAIVVENFPIIFAQARSLAIMNRTVDLEDTVVNTPP